jgi:uncharacterized protein (DUF433 family)
MEKILNRITINPDVLHGKPCIRNMRFSVSQLLQLLSSGMTEEEILNDYNFLEKEDIQACILYASKMFDTKNIIPQKSA